MKKIILGTIALVLIGLIAWQLMPSPQPQEEDMRPVIGVTIGPLASIAQELFGDAVQIVQLVPAGASPHTFEPSPTLVARAQRSEVVFYIGHGLDEWVIEAAGRDAYFAQVSAGIELHEGGHDHDDEEHADEVEESEEEVGLDPHYWLSFTNAPLIARNMAAVFQDRYPELAQAHDVMGALEQWTQRLKEAEGVARQALADVDERVLVTFHDGWGYFAEDLGFEVGATFEPFPGREPSPAYIAQLQRVIRENNVTRIYSEPQLASVNLEALMNDLGVELRVLDPLGGDETATDYIELLRYNALQLR